MKISMRAFYIFAVKSQLVSLKMVFVHKTNDRHSARTHCWLMMGSFRETQLLYTTSFYGSSIEITA